jgi:TatD DNase family protein
MIDTHCHLTFPEFAGQVPAVLARAKQHGVHGAITISTSTANAPECLAIARDHANVWCTAGVHPLYSDDPGSLPHVWDRLLEVARHPRCVAWGELGLDRHYSDPAFDVQRAVLDEQLDHLLRWKREGVEKPVVIHCREAFDDLIPVLKRSGLDPTRMVFHCFTGGPREMRMVLDLGACASFTGVATYRNAADVRQAARLVPRDRIMVETDAPYLSPEPKRGVRPCEPWMVSITARSLASTRDDAWPEFNDALNRNTARFFGIPEALIRGADA